MGWLLNGASNNACQEVFALTHSLPQENQQPQSLCIGSGFWEAPGAFVHDRWQDVVNRSGGTFSRAIFNE